MSDKRASFMVFSHGCIMPQGEGRRLRFSQGHPKHRRCSLGGAPAVWETEPGRYTSVMVTSMLPRVALE